MSMTMRRLALGLAPLAALMTLGGVAHAQDPVASPSAVQPITGPSEAELGYEPGTKRFRLVNVSGQDLDLVTRTSGGTVVAFVARAAVPSGAFTDHVGAPEPGSVVAAVAGADELTCVSTCPHFLHRQNTSFIDDDQVTLVIGPAASIELWEQQAAPSAGFYNTSIAAVDPAQGLVLVVAGPVAGNEQGLRIAVDGVEGCQEDGAQPGMLAGTNLALAIGVTGPTALTLHDAADTDCSAPPVAGPFPVEVNAGERSYLILHGPLDAIQGLVVPIP